MAAYAETLRRLFQGVDNIRVSQGREAFSDVITRRTIAAQRAGDDYQIADFNVLLQRAAAADANQRLCSGAA